MLISRSNHPSLNWQKIQLQAAVEYGKIIDMPFIEKINYKSAIIYEKYILLQTKSKYYGWIQ